MFCSSSKPNLACCCRAVDGKGVVTTYQPNGKELVKLSATADDTGGMVSVFNKTGEDVVQLVVC